MRTVAAISVHQNVAAYARLSPGARFVLVIIENAKRITTTYGDLACVTGCSRDAVVGYVETLQKYGWVHAARSGRGVIFSTEPVTDERVLKSDDYRARYQAARAKMDRSVPTGQYVSGMPVVRDAVGLSFVDRYSRRHSLSESEDELVVREALATGGTNGNAD
jgi:hypothetical protein